MLIKKEVIADIISYALYKHHRKNQPEDLLEESLNCDITYIHKYRDYLLGVNHYKDAFEANTVFCISYVLHEMVSGDFIEDVTSVTKGVLDILEYNAVSYSKLMSLKVRFELEGVCSNEYFSIYFADADKSLAKYLRVILRNCNLDKAYISPYIELVLYNSEVVLLGEHLLVNEGDIYLFDDTVIDFSIFKDRNVQLYLVLSRFLANAFSKDLWSDSFLPCQEDGYHRVDTNLYRKVQSNLVKANAPFENVMICSTNIKDDITPGVLKAMYLDRYSTLLYINYSTRLGRIFRGSCSLVYRPFISLSNYFLKSGDDMGNLPKWMLSMPNNSICYYSAAFLGVAAVKDIEEYFAVDLSFNAPLDVFSLNISLSQVCNMRNVIA